MNGAEWQFLLAEASQLRRSGRVAEAIAAYERVLAAKPDLPDSWYNLGWLQRQARDFASSLESYRRALDLGIGEPEEVHLNRAVIYSDYLHDPREAERELRAALECNPNYVPALLNLGNLHEDLGQRTEAKAAYGRILKIDPTHSLALARLAGVSHSAELDAVLADRMRLAIARSKTAPAESADLGFALAGLLDAAGHFEEAFNVVSAANEASRAATGARYDRSAHERFVGRLITTFDRPVQPHDGEGPAPIFICGMFRSGSTLVEQMLAGHPAIQPYGELDLIPQLVEGIADYPEAVATADAETVARWRSFYRRGVPPTRDRVRVTDKRPDNFLHIGLIKTLFPQAKIVHTFRNPLDNLLSIYFLHLNPDMAYALDLGDAAHWYQQYQRLMNHWQALYAGDILNLDYDALVRDPESLMRQLLGFLRIEWDDGIFNFHKRKSAVKTASVWQVRERLHSRSSGRWKNYRNFLLALPHLPPLSAG